MIQSIGGMGTRMMPVHGAGGPPDPQQVFDKLDADGDGAINPTELQGMADHLAEKMGDQAPSAEELMTKLDSDGTAS